MDAREANDRALLRKAKEQWVEDNLQNQTRVPIWNENLVEIERFAKATGIPIQGALAQLVRLGLAQWESANSGNAVQTPESSRVPPVGDGAQSPQSSGTTKRSALVEIGPQMAVKCAQIDRLTSVMRRMQLHKLLED